MIKKISKHDRFALLKIRGKAEEEECWEIIMQRGRQKRYYYSRTTKDLISFLQDCGISVYDKIEIIPRKRINPKKVFILPV